MDADLRDNIVTFFSYKGGSGRTLCAANLAVFLANKIGATPKKPILLVDSDIDSAGLTIFLEKVDHFDRSPWSVSKVLSGEWDLVIRDSKRQFFKEALIDVSTELGAEPGSIRFLGGEVQIGSSEPAKMGSVMKKINDLMLALREENYSAVIVDSASGRQDIARAWHMKSSTMVYCCRLTEQFLFGTEKQLADVLMPSATPTRPPNIILLPTAVPNLPPNSQWQNLLNSKMARLRYLTSKKSENNNIILHDPICEVESFKWLETVLYRKQFKIQLEKDEKKALGSFDTLADQVINLWNCDGSASR